MEKHVSWNDNNIAIKEYKIDEGNKLRKLKGEIKMCPCQRLCPTENNDNIIRTAHSRVLYCHEKKLIQEYNESLKKYHLLFENYLNNNSSDFVLLL